jgi:hypothetical protein
MSKDQIKLYLEQEIAIAVKNRGGAERDGREKNWHYYNGRIDALVEILRKLFPEDG